MPNEILLPTEIDKALRDGAALAVSISGGKDSHAMLTALVAEHEARPEWTGPIFAIHADLGRLEWDETPETVERHAREAGVELVVVRREKGDLLARWRERMEKLAGTGKPFWSSSAARYCTSDMKRDPIDRHLRRFTNIVSAEGIRAEESPARARKGTWEVRKRIDNTKRRALTWRPIFTWTTEDVWRAVGTSAAELDRRRALYRAGEKDAALAGWTGHAAYVYGNTRLSCAICVLASRADIENGARHNPKLYRRLVAMEEESGFGFRSDLWLRDLALDSRRLPVLNERRAA